MVDAVAQGSVIEGVVGKDELQHSLGCTFEVIASMGTEVAAVVCP